MIDFIKSEIQKSRDTLQLIQQDSSLLQLTQIISEQCIATLQSGGKILFAGNGGSAADSQHLAAELVGRLRFDRPGLAAIALTTDTSALTAIANDYSFEHLFSRQIEALGRKGDVFIGISTSGKSPNILKALETARLQGLITVGLTGNTAPLMAERCDYVLTIPSKETSKIQECHILLGHIICSLVEQKMFSTFRVD